MRPDFTACPSLSNPVIRHGIAYCSECLSRREVIQNVSTFEPCERRTHDSSVSWHFQGTINDGIEVLETESKFESLLVPIDHPVPPSHRTRNLLSCITNMKSSFSTSSLSRSISLTESKESSSCKVKRPRTRTRIISNPIKKSPPPEVRWNEFILNSPKPMMRTYIDPSTSDNDGVTAIQKLTYLSPLQRTKLLKAVNRRFQELPSRASNGDLAIFHAMTLFVGWTENHGLLPIELCSTQCSVAQIDEAWLQ